MSKELVALNIEDFEKINLENVELLNSKLYNLVLDSVLCNSMDSLERDLKKISNNFERINNLLGLENKSNKACYFYGSISAITNLILDIIDDHALTSMLDHISKSYTLLLPILKIIKDHTYISVSDLTKEMNMKSISSLSNFLKRIDKYNLVVKRKIGTTNYISLTYIGERLLSQNKKSMPTVPDYAEISMTQLYSLLDNISDELHNANPSTVKVICDDSLREIKIKEASLLKRKIEKIFYARDEYMRLKFKPVYNQSTHENFDGMVSLEDNEIMNYYSVIEQVE